MTTVRRPNLIFFYRCVALDMSVLKISSPHRMPRVTLVSYRNSFLFDDFPRRFPGTDAFIPCGKGEAPDGSILTTRRAVPKLFNVRSQLNSIAGETLRGYLSVFFPGAEVSPELWLLLVRQRYWPTLNPIPGPEIPELKGRGGLDSFGHSDTIRHSFSKRGFLVPCTAGASVHERRLVPRPAPALVHNRGRKEISI